MTFSNQPKSLTCYVYKKGKEVMFVFHNLSEKEDEPEWVLAMKNDVAIALCHLRDGQLRPKRVFNV